MLLLRIFEILSEDRCFYRFFHEKVRTLFHHRVSVVAREFVVRQNDKKIRLHKMIYAHV